MITHLLDHLISHGAVFADVQRLVSNEALGNAGPFQDQAALFGAIDSVQENPDFAAWEPGLRRVVDGRSLFWDEYRLQRDQGLSVRPDAPAWVHRAVSPLSRHDPIAHNIAAWGPHPAIVRGPRILSYAALDERADRLAGFLDHINKEPSFGDPFVKTGMVGMYFLGGNRPETVEIMLASKRAGVPYTPFSKYLDPRTMVDDLIFKDYRILFVDEEGLKAIGRDWGGFYLRSIPIVVVGGLEGDGILPYERIIQESRRPIVAPEKRDDSSDLEAILFTSGTTGKPKRIERSASSLRVDPVFGIDRTDRLLVMADLFHGGYIRWVNEHLFHGAAVYLAPAGADMETLARLIEQNKITSLLMAPVLLRRMLAAFGPEEGARRFESLRRVAVIGAPFPPQLKKEAMAALGRRIFWDVYATTEYGEITLLPPEEMAEHLETVGRAVPGVEIDIRDAGGHSLQAGEIGTIYVKTPFTGGAFVKTDDDGSLDEEGYLKVAGRTSDLILSRGINFYAGEIEAAMHQIPQIAEVAVMGVEHPEYGEEIVAAVVLGPDVDVSEAWVQERTAQWLYDRRATPRRVVFLPSLPRNTAGKIVQSELRAAVQRALEGGAVASDPSGQGTGSRITLHDDLPSHVPAAWGRLYEQGLISRRQLAWWSQALVHVQKSKNGLWETDFLYAAALQFTERNEIEFFVARLVDGDRILEAYRKTLEAFHPNEEEKNRSPDETVLSAFSGMGWARQNQGTYSILERSYRHVHLAPDGRLFDLDFLYRHEGRYDVAILSQFLNEETDPRRLSLKEALPSVRRLVDEIPGLVRISFVHTAAVMPYRMEETAEDQSSGPADYPRFDAGWRRFGEYHFSSEGSNEAEIIPLRRENGQRVLVVRHRGGIDILDEAGPLVKGLAEGELTAMVPLESLRNPAVVHQEIREAEPDDRFQPRIALAREEERKSGRTTVFTLPASGLVLPEDIEGQKRLDAVLAYLTGLLRARFPENEAYSRPLRREDIEDLTRERPLLSVLGAELPPMDPNVAFYAGSFDPVTNGHLEIIAKAAKAYDKIIVGVATNSNKTYKFSAEERRQLVLDSLRSVGVTNVEVVIFPTSTPTVQVASRLGAGTMIRGARDAEDLKYEIVLAWTNQMLDPRVRTALLTPSRFGHVSSTKVKGGAHQDVSAMVPGPVFWRLMKEDWEALERRPKLVGLVGGIGSGKSTVRELLAKQEGVLTIDFDRTWHELMRRSEVARQLADVFGEDILTDGAVDRIKLRRVFEGPKAGQSLLNSIARSHVMRHTYDLMRSVARERIDIETIVFEGFGIVDSGMPAILDRLVFVETPEEERIRRALQDLRRREMAPDHVRRIVASQRDTLDRARSAAHVVIENSGVAEALEGQVGSIISSAETQSAPTGP